MGFWDDAEVISVYTRAQALEDGELVDVTGAALDAGFKVPVAVTSAVWADLNQVPAMQDLAGRLWDMLFMGALAAKQNSGTTEFNYMFYMQVGRAKRYQAKMHIGGGDHGETVITIMRPEED